MSVKQTYVDEINDIMDDYGPAEQEIKKEEPIAGIWEDVEKKNDETLHALAQKQFEVKDSQANKLLAEKAESVSGSRSEKKEYTSGYSSVYKDTSEKSSGYYSGYRSGYSRTTSKSIEEQVDEGFAKIHAQAIKDVEAEQSKRLPYGNPQFDMLIRNSGKSKLRKRITQMFGKGTKGRKVIIIGGIIFLKVTAMMILEYKLKGKD